MTLHLAHSEPDHGPRLPAADRALCMRPGERPIWLDATAHKHQWDGWRAAAAASRLPLDVALGLLLEHALARAELAAAELNDGLLDAAAATESAATPRLAPTEDLRLWVAQLVGVGPPPPGDELPDIAIAQRLAHRSTPSIRASAWQQLDQLERAARCDAAAACLGLTLEAWAMRVALAAASRSGR